MKILKFGAVWCNGCIIMKPRWAKIEQENPWLKNEFYDYDQDKQAVEKYHIDSNLPTFVFVDKDGEEFLRLSGEVEEAKLLEIIEANRDR